MRNVRRGISRTLSIVVIVVVVVVALGSFVGYYLSLPATSTVSTTSPTLPTTTNSISTTSHPASSNSSSGTIVIGLETLLQGANAVLGQQTIDGAQLAVDQINAQGGVLGRQLKLVVADEGDQTSTGPAITAAQILTVQDNVSFMIGPQSSGDVSAALPVTTARPIIQVLSVASLDNLMTPPQNKYLWRTDLPDYGYAVMLANWLVNTTHAKSVIMEGEDFIYMHEIFNTTAQIAAQNGINVMAVDYYPFSATDYSAAVNKIATDKPNAVIVGMSGSNEVAFQKQIAANPATVNIPRSEVIGQLSIASQALSTEQAAPGAAQYLFGCNSYFLTNNSQAFVQALKAKYNIQPSAYSVDTYTALYVIAQAIQRAGTTNVQSVAAAMQQTDYTGPGGRIVFQSNHDPIIGSNYKSGSFYQIYIKSNNVYYENLYPSSIANWTAVNTATGQPFS